MPKPATSDPTTHRNERQWTATPVRAVPRPGAGCAVIYRLVPPLDGHQHGVTDFMQLPGSRMNAPDHAIVLAGVGYVITQEGEDQ